MKILIDLTSLADNLSGIERYAGSIAYQMVTQFEEEYVLIFKEKVYHTFEIFKENTNVEMIVIPRCRKIFFNQIKLPLEIRRHKCDWYLFMAFPVPIILFKKNMISTIHDICCWDCPETMTFLSKWYFRISHRVAIRKCTSIITISEFSKQRIVEKLNYPESKIVIVYCGVDGNFDSFKSKSRDNNFVKQKYKLPEKFFLTLSTLEPRKNLTLLLEAYNDLRTKKEIKIPLVLAGRKGWKVDDLLEKVNRDTRDNLYFTGFIDDKDLQYVYQNAECFVFPSKYEGFGMPPLEAMACGTTVISSDSTSLPEVLGEAAFYFKNESKKDLEQCLKEVQKLDSYEKKRREDQGIMNTRKYSWSKEAYKLYQYLDKKRGKSIR
ncbi:glycosyltransferase family 4 protein [Enterococcus sp. DIV0187]|uniref:glycosyltransferase family 4 protein n=1 Tax=Enterococcus sp. DIV0187 TaxID=2774644 RepID=UPI003F242F42